MGGRSGPWANARAAIPILRAGSWAAVLFKTALPAVEGFRFAPRLGVHASRLGRLLLAGARRSGGRPHARAVG